MSSSCFDTRRAWRASRVCLLAAACLSFCTALPGCRGASQAGIDDPEVFKELDALFTAVNSRRPELLKDSVGRLEKLHAEHRIPDDAFAQLKAISDVAAEGKWSDAAPRLYDFMRAQRRAPSKSAG